MIELKEGTFRAKKKQQKNNKQTKLKMVGFRVAYTRTALILEYPRLPRAMVLRFKKMYKYRLNCKGHGNDPPSGGFRGGSAGSLEPLSGTKLFHFHGEI